VEIGRIAGTGRHIALSGESTLSTVQIDFHQPARFDLHYIGADGARHRPVVVHRSITGSVERAVAHLIEAHRGAFPAWPAVGAPERSPGSRPLSRPRPSVLPSRHRPLVPPSGHQASVSRSRRRASA
jgi:hypothetical protein